MCQPGARTKILFSEVATPCSTSRSEGKTCNKFEDVEGQTALMLKQLPGRLVSAALTISPELGILDH